jgi:hypothetical protein
MSVPRDPGRARRYLLGDLPEEEMARLEVEYLDADGAFDELLAVENELIDAHLDGRLSAEEEGQFARRFLSSPGRVERVAFARALRASAAKAPPAPAPEGFVAVEARPPARRAASFLGWAAAAVLAVGGGALGVRVLSLQAALRAAAAAAQAREEQLVGVRTELASARAEIERVRAAVTTATEAPRFFLAVLRAGATRDGGARPAVVLPDGTEELRLQLIAPGDAHRTYAAEVENADGRRIASRTALSAGRFQGDRAVELRLDARALATDEYVVTLRGVRPDGSSEIVAEYAFPLKRD